MTPPRKQLGRYRLFEPLGSGGMSVVYKGLDTTLDREVAVKLLHPHLAQKPEARRRLSREARAVAQLQHPHILEVFDFAGEDSEEAYLVTEYIRGRTLKDFVAEVPLDPPEIAALVAHPIAAALAQAHQAGILHRDLKPENVMVREDGVLKLMDFGIAKILGRDDRMTQTGALVGSPAHMAPEIISGEEGGKEADVFSLGTLLYFLFTRRLPFEGPNTTATLKRIVDGAYQDPRQYAPALSDSLVQLLAQCLATRPEQRLPDAGAVLAGLSAALEEVGLSAVGEELASFFADPEDYRQTLRGRLAEVWFKKGEALAAQRPVQALSALSQALALVPDHPQATALIQKLRRRSRRRRNRSRIGWSAAGFAALLSSLALVQWKPPATPPPVTPVARPIPQTFPLASPVRAEAPAPPAKVASPSSLPRREPARGMEHPAPPRSAPVSFTVQVRPFGSVQLDEGPSTQVLQQHTLSALPGKHRLRISCPDFCEPVEEEVELASAGGEVFHLGARAKPALLSFAVEPAGAEVQVGEERRVAESTVSTPFLVRSPRGPVRLEHLVRYEVRREGYTPMSGTLHLAPGESRTVSLHLTPQ